MRLFDDISQGLKETAGSITEGWQHLWMRARNAITYFAPLSENDKSPQPRTRWGIMPIDLKETDAALEVHLEAPGMLRENFDIKIEHQLLIIKGTKCYKSNHDEGRYHVAETAIGHFERIVPLPCQVDEGTTIAKYKSGVLSIKLPKAQTDKVRRISVN